MKTKVLFQPGSIILLFMVMLAVSCSGDPKKKEEARIKELVTSYDSLMVTAARTGDVTPLSKIASKDILQKLQIWIAAWRDSDLYMDASLKKLEFRNINISDKQAKAVTSEAWDYDYKHLKDNRVMLPRTHITYEMEYIASKVKKNGDDHWVITAINVKSEQREKLRNEGRS